jgi:hypothetical protein
MATMGETMGDNWSTREGKYFLMYRTRAGQGEEIYSLSAFCLATSGMGPGHQVRTEGHFHDLGETQAPNRGNNLPGRTWGKAAGRRGQTGDDLRGIPKEVLHRAMESRMALASWRHT